MAEAIVGIFDPGELFTPGGLVRRGHTTKSRLQILIATLCLSVILGMKTGGETDLWSPVGDNVGRNSMESEHVPVNNRVVSKAVGSLGKATKCTALEKRSIIVRITVLPAEGGSSVRKLTAI